MHICNAASLLHLICFLELLLSIKFIQKICFKLEAHLQVIRGNSSFVTEHLALFIKHHLVHEQFSASYVFSED